MTFRLPARPVLLTVGFGLAAAVFTAFGLTQPAALVAAVLFAVVAVRCALLRVVADGEGITVHNVLYTRHVPWSQVREVAAGSTGTDVDGGFLTVRSVTVTTTDGRTMRAAGASAWSSAPVRETAAKISALRP